MSSIYQHKKSGGRYKLLNRFARIEIHGIDGPFMAVYTNIDNGMTWVRPASEFFDGRFKVITKDEAELSS